MLAWAYASTPTSSLEIPVELLTVDFYLKGMAYLEMYQAGEDAMVAIQDTAASKHSPL